MLKIITFYRKTVNW